MSLLVMSSTDCRRCSYATDSSRIILARSLSAVNRFETNKAAIATMCSHIGSDACYVMCLIYEVTMQAKLVLCCTDVK